MNGSQITTKEIVDELNLMKDGLKGIINTGLELKTIPDSPEQKILRAGLDDKLEWLTTLQSSNKKTNAFIKRLVRYKTDLLHFVDHGEVEYHNNRAERAIRPSVIFRKISFGHRSSDGAKNYAILASSLETGRQKNMHLLDLIQTVWSTPPNKFQPIINSLLDSS